MSPANTENLNDALLLGRRFNGRVPETDQRRQATEAGEILKRLQAQPGVILADEVGMGKTFVALAVAWCVLSMTRGRPIIVMVPPHLIHKWEQDLRTFCELYLDGIEPRARYELDPHTPRRSRELRFGRARTALELFRRLDDPSRARCQFIFLAQGAMSRREGDPWVRLALMRHTLKRYGQRPRLKQVRHTLPRFVADLVHGGKRLQHRSSESEAMWAELFRRRPRYWREVYNAHLKSDRGYLDDDPVPRLLMRAMRELDLSHVADALEQVPLRNRGSEQRMQQRLGQVRRALDQIERELWSHLIAGADWSSPLLIMDEAHHLKNPQTRLARQLASPDSEQDLKAGEGTLASRFDRMLFMTATPFQLGHEELVRVIERFGGIRWRSGDLMTRDAFHESCQTLRRALDASQRTAVQLQRSWQRMGEDDLPPGDACVDRWWRQLRQSDRDTLTHRQRALLDAFDQAVEHHRQAQRSLCHWIIRHNKLDHWPAAPILRRQRRDGAAINGGGGDNGLTVPATQLLPFFLAARSAADPRQDLLGEALCSSYQAFRHTRSDNREARDDEEALSNNGWGDRRMRHGHVHGRWFLDQFDRVLADNVDAAHPKIAATVARVADLWASGEKVLIFAFYRRTCRALALEVSRAIHSRIMAEAARQLGTDDEQQIEQHILNLQRRFFDREDGPARRAIDKQLDEILHTHAHRIDSTHRQRLTQVMRRFLRVRTTLVLAFPLAQRDTLSADDAVSLMLERRDASNLSWREKFHRFLSFLLDRCTADECEAYLDAAGRIQTGDIRVQDTEAQRDTDGDGVAAARLANVQVASGETPQDVRPRLMRAFNTPFFPDVLVCSPVMAEGVDLHLNCRHVIHHDLAWNPSSIEQRTGRVDRLGCKAENRHSIEVYCPYISGAADERQYRVMMDRDRWFRVVMGSDQVNELVPPDADLTLPPPPAAFQDSLGFDLSLDNT
ncbi:MAG: DEAD/DEAH box helicase [Phycisphaeraceae bacterium]